MKSETHGRVTVLKEEINLVKIMEIMMKLWWLILIFAVVGALVAYSISSFLIAPMYTSTASLYVDGTQRIEGTGMDMTTTNTNRTLVSTYVEILCSNTALERVVQNCGYDDVKADNIRANIRMSAANETEILEIKYTDSSPERAEKILRTLVSCAPAAISDVIDGCRVNTVDKATLPKSPSSPDINQNTFIGMFIGIVIGIAIIFIKELLDTRIKDEDDLKTRYNIPVLGEVPTLVEKS